MKQANWISPSILSANFAQLGKEVDAVLEAGADSIHFDVMDNHYVPNLTIGPLVCESLKNHGVNVPIDVHLMVSPVDNLIEQFAKAGATYITIHPEATRHLDRSLQLIAQLGCKPGVVFNPTSPLHPLDYVLDKIDMVLLMSVNPGFPGQAFIPSVYEKIKETRQRLDQANRSIRLEVDGGINLSNIKKVAEAGADTFVMGSAIFTSDNYRDTIQSARKVLA